MTQHTQVRLLDDLAHANGEEVDADKTVSFSLENGDYEIDLTAENVAKLHEALAPFVAKARRVARKTGTRRTAKVAPKVASTPRTPPAQTTAARTSNQEIRNWAIGQQMKVGDRGRIPTWVVEAYRKAH